MRCTFMISIYKKHKKLGTQFIKSRRDPYRLFDVLRHDFPELAL